MNRWVLGDIHGEYEKLKKAFKYIKKEDLLITLGEIVDRGENSKGCIDLLLTHKNRIDVKGNHDEMFMDFLKHKQVHKHGLNNTIYSYMTEEETKIKHPFYYDLKLPESHKEFFENQKLFYVLEDMVFVHGGFNRHYEIDKQLDETVYTWDRDLMYEHFSNLITNTLDDFRIKGNYKKIFIGHTPTQMFGSEIPLKIKTLINVDTGSGKGGKL